MKHSNNGDKQEHAATEDRNDHSVGRRTYLKLAGTALASVSAAVVESGTVRGANDGYGSGGYGKVAYGGEDSLIVSTQDAMNVGSTLATLNGSLDNLGGADSADCYFKWRQTSADSWNTTAKQTLTSTGSFSEGLSGLTDGIDYECRAVTEASDGDISEGSSVTFTTKSSAIELGSSTTLLPRDGYIVNCSFDSNHDGYTGDGFVNFPPDDDGHVEWTVNTDTETEYDLTIQYALGDAERTGVLSAAGTTQNVTVSSTGAWDNWETLTETVTLPEGESIVRIGATGEDFGNVDLVELYES